MSMFKQIVCESGLKYFQISTPIIYELMDIILINTLIKLTHKTSYLGVSSSLELALGKTPVGSSTKSSESE